jgi:hypothetical protein
MSGKALGDRLNPASIGGSQVVETDRRNPLLPWIIGLIIIVISDIYIGHLFYATQCQAPAIAQFLVLIVVPAVYLVLMYLTLKSQPRPCEGGSRSFAPT